VTYLKNPLIFQTIDCSFARSAFASHAAHTKGQGLWKISEPSLPNTLREVFVRISMRQEALELTFRVLLSCQCPLTDEQERALFDRFVALKPGDTIDCTELLSIFKSNENTPIQRLVHFSVWMTPAGSKEIVIEREHVLRHFASSYHWDHVVAPNLPAAYRKVVSIATWFIGHMLLPIALVRTGNGILNGIYRFGDGEIRLKNLFIAPEIVDLNAGIWGVHFASAITPLSSDEAALVQMLGDMNPLLAEFRREISTIDYLDFEHYGYYRAICIERHACYWHGSSGRISGTHTGCGCAN
jgi:hypothetical protein